MTSSLTNPLSYLGFQRIEPSAKLSNLIDCYWFVYANKRKSLNSREYLHPDGGMGIILNYGDALDLEGKPQTERCILDGTNTFTRELGLHGFINAVGIRFKPAGAFLFLPMPLTALKNETTSLSNISTNNYSDLYDNVYKSKTNIAKASVIEEWLSISLQPNKCISNITWESINFINRHKGLAPISSLVETSGHNQRKIERLFNLQIGMTPKEYSRILRIAEARRLIKSGIYTTWTDIAHELRYFDQAHFTHQFKNVVGVTPREYSKRKSIHKPLQKCSHERYRFSRN